MNTSYRYVVNARQDVTRGSGYYYIYDRKLMDECGLPLNERNLSLTAPLRWYYKGTPHSPEAVTCRQRAQEWLWRCVEKWGDRPHVDQPHPHDVNWAAVGVHLMEAARANTYR